MNSKRRLFLLPTNYSTLVIVSYCGRGLLRYNTVQTMTLTQSCSLRLLIWHCTLLDKHYSYVVCAIIHTSVIDMTASLLVFRGLYSFMSTSAPFLNYFLGTTMAVEEWLLSVVSLYNASLDTTLVAVEVEQRKWVKYIYSLKTNQNTVSVSLTEKLSGLPYQLKSESVQLLLFMFHLQKISLATQECCPGVGFHQGQLQTYYYFN